MDDREVYALMKLVEEGVLNSEQSRRVMEALRNARDQDSALWDQVQGWTRWIGDQVGRAIGGKREAATLAIHVYNLSDQKQRYQFQVPLQFFLFFKGFLTWLPSEAMLEYLDFQEIYRRAEEGRTGVVWENVVEDRGEKIVVIIE